MMISFALIDLVSIVIKTNKLAANVATPMSPEMVWKNLNQHKTGSTGQQQQSSSKSSSGFDG